MIQVAYVIFSSKGVSPVRVTTADTTDEVELENMLTIQHGLPVEIMGVRVVD